MNKVDANNLSSQLLRSCQSFITITLISMAINFMLHGRIHNAVLNKYPGDSFHTLGVGSAIGLTVITTLLLTFVLLLSWFSTKFCYKHYQKKSVLYKFTLLILNLIMIAGVYLLMLVIAPQLFYTYYQLIFTGLPVQWVIKPLSLEVLFKLISLPSDASMADHAAGFTLWVLLFNTTLQWIWYSLSYKRAV